MTNPSPGDIIGKLSERAEPREGFEKRIKNFKKLSKKVLTRQRRCGIILRLSQKRAANGH